MIGQNTIKNRKIRNEVTRLEAEIRKLKAANAILQEDRQELRSQKDKLTNQLRRIREPVVAQIDSIKADYEKHYNELTDSAHKAEIKVASLKEVNSKLKSSLIYAAAAGVVAGLLLAPYITNL